jgi:hypothetical protein
MYAYSINFLKIGQSNCLNFRYNLPRIKAGSSAIYYVYTIKYTLPYILTAADSALYIAPRTTYLIWGVRYSSDYSTITRITCQGPGTSENVANFT